MWIKNLRSSPKTTRMVLIAFALLLLPSSRGHDAQAAPSDDRYSSFVTDVRRMMRENELVFERPKIEVDNQAREIRYNLGHVTAGSEMNALEYLIHAQCRVLMMIHFSRNGSAARRRFWRAPLENLGAVVQAGLDVYSSADISESTKRGHGQTVLSSVDLMLQGRLAAYQQDAPGQRWMLRGLASRAVWNSTSFRVETTPAGGSIFVTSRLRHKIAKRSGASPEDYMRRVEDGDVFALQAGNAVGMVRWPDGTTWGPAPLDRDAEDKVRLVPQP